LDGATRLLALGLLLLSVCVSARGSDDLPDGQGKAVVERVCQSCHELDVIAGDRNDRQGWTATVEAMKTRGASATDQEVNAIIDYLSSYLGRDPVKVNVNNASDDQIKSVLGLTSEESDAIVQYRKEHGDFKDWDSLTKVKGLDSKKLEPKKSQITFSAQENDTR
jgi:competence ComEA-like helix-hairpin-helix protein